jgi:hypothetical protein
MVAGRPIADVFAPMREAREKQGNEERARYRKIWYRGKIEKN